MAEVEVESPAAAPEAVEEQPAAATSTEQELPTYDPAKLIMVKGKVKKPVKPDDTERNVTLEKLSAEIKRCTERIAEIKAIREQRRSRGVNPEAAEHKKRKEGLSAEWNAVLKQKMHIREEFQRANTEREVIKNELRELRSKIPRGTRLENLEADIAALEYKIEHESLSATEEKRVHQQLSTIVAARPLQRQTSVLEEKLKVVEANRGSAKARLDQCDAVLEGIKEKERVEQSALDEIRRQRDEANVDLPALEVEKQECWEVIQVLRAKMSEVRDEFNVRWKEWSELNKHYSAWRRIEQHKQYLDRQAAREARDAERNGDGPSPAAQAAQAQAEPYESEILTVEQLLTYLRKFVAVEETVAKTEQKAVEVPQGLKPFKRKDDEDLSFFTAVKKKGKGAKPQEEKKAAPAETKRKLNHALDILQTFMLLSIDVPQTTAEIPATVEKAEAKKQEFLEKRKAAKEAPAAAPKPQVLPANGETNGHAEEEEEEAAAPAPERESVKAAEQAAKVKEEEEEAAAKAEEEVQAAAEEARAVKVAEEKQASEAAAKAEAAKAEALKAEAAKAEAAKAEAAKAEAAKAEAARAEAAKAEAAKAEVAQAEAAKAEAAKAEAAKAEAAKAEAAKAEAAKAEAEKAAAAAPASSSAPAPAAAAASALPAKPAKEAAAAPSTSPAKKSGKTDNVGVSLDVDATGELALKLNILTGP